MYPRMKICGILLCLPLLVVCSALLVGCGGEKDSNAGSESRKVEEPATTDKSGDVGKGQKDDAKVAEVVVKKDGQFEFHGEVVKDLKSMPTAVAKKMFPGSRKQDMAAQIVLAAGPNATIDQLKKAVFELQGYGFFNVHLKAGEKLIAVPTFAYAFDQAKPNVFLVSINSFDNKFGGMKIGLNGGYSYLESTSIDSGKEYIEKNLNMSVEKLVKSGSAVKQKLHVEVAAPQAISAEDYLTVCAEVLSCVESHSTESKIEFKTWPLGMPREQAVEMEPLLDEIHIEPTGIDKLEAETLEPQEIFAEEFNKGFKKDKKGKQ